MVMNVTPLHDRILVRRLEQQEIAKGGIIIPDTAKEKPHEGEVISVGAGKRDKKGGRIPLDVKACDRILFGKYTGNDITLDGNTFGNGPSVPRNWFVGDLELGVAVMFNNWRLSYTQVFETHTFRGEQGGLHQFGSLALSARF